MILGLDISSSVIGVAILNDTLLEFYQHFDVKKYKVKFDYFDILSKIEAYFEDIKSKYNVTSIHIEEPLKRISSGTSSINTIITLYSYNFPITWMVYKIFGIKPIYIKASQARKNLCIKKSNLINNKIKYHKNTKEIKIAALDVILELYPELINKFTFTKTGLLQPYWFDIADAIVVALMV